MAKDRRVAKGSALSWEPLSRLMRDGIEDLLIEHYEEVAQDKERIPYAPDWDDYYRLERAGVFKALSLRLDGALAGYNWFWVMPHRHNRHTLMATNDVIYLRPLARKGWNGVRLIRQAEQDLRALGVVKIMYHSKPDVLLGRNGGTLGGLLEKLGYEFSETVHKKVLE